MVLNREQILAIDDAKYTIVHVDEWDADIRVKSMSTKDRIAFEKKQSECKSQTELMVALVLFTCVDDNGKRIFEDGDLEALENKSPLAIIKIFNAAIDLNILNSQKVEDNAKNS